MKILPQFITGGLLILFAVAAVSDRARLESDYIIPLTILLAAFAGFCWSSYRLKSVAVDNHYLYVSGWSKHIKIPLSHIESVNYAAVSLITVRLKSAGTFGHTIYFMPTLGAEIRARLNSPSVVEDLRRRIEQTSKLPATDEK